MAEGRIIVDGRRAELGERLEGNERVFFDGKRVKLRTGTTRAAHETLAYYKPDGEITARRDPEGRRTVFDDLRKPAVGRWISVGRLDVSSSGLLLLTTDGELAHRLMHPSFEVPREYAVRLLGELSDSQLAQLEAGIELDDGPARLDWIRFSGGTGSNHWYQLSLHEGRNREVRRVFEALGITVSRLIRTRYGPIELGRMRRGEHRRLSPTELAGLYESVRLTGPRAQ